MVPANHTYSVRKCLGRRFPKSLREFQSKFANAYLMTTLKRDVSLLLAASDIAMKPGLRELSVQFSKQGAAKEQSADFRSSFLRKKLSPGTAPHARPF